MGLTRKELEDGLEYADRAGNDRLVQWHMARIDELDHEEEQDA